jgi:hypothetical protein
MLMLVLTLCVLPVAAQETPPESTSTVFFLARDDTNQDGQVTDIDNIRLYEVALDGTILFATPPDVHVLMVAIAPTAEYKAAVIAQMPTSELALTLYNNAGALDQEVDLSSAAYVSDLEWQSDALVWQAQQKDGRQVTTFLDPLTGSTRAEEISGPAATPTYVMRVLRVKGQPFLIQQVLNDDLLIVQQEGLLPEDALWIYEKQADRVTPFNAWYFIEPLLIAAHSQSLRIAILGREFDGSMSLYTVDLTNGVAMPGLNWLLTGLIDPPYTAMQWTADGTTLLLTGESGDFVVSNIGRIEAVYALDVATGAFTRLSPEGTLVDRASIKSR